MSKGESRPSSVKHDDKIRMLNHSLETNRLIEVYQEQSPRRNKIKPLVLAKTDNGEEVLCAQLMSPTDSYETGTIVWFHLSAIENIELTHKQAKAGYRSIDLSETEFVSATGWKQSFAPDSIEVLTENARVKVNHDGN